MTKQEIVETYYSNVHGIAVEHPGLLDFRGHPEIFGQKRSNDRQRLLPGFAFSCLIRFYGYGPGKEYRTASFKADYLGEHEVIEIPKNKYNPHLTVPVSLPRFAIAVGLRSQPLSSVGEAAVGYFRPGESPVMVGVNNQAIKETLGFVPGSNLAPHFGLVAEGSLFCLTANAGLAPSLANDMHGEGVN